MGYFAESSQTIRNGLKKQKCAAVILHISDMNPYNQPQENPHRYHYIQKEPFAICEGLLL